MVQPRRCHSRWFRRDGDRLKWFASELTWPILGVPWELRHKPRPADLPLIQTPFSGEILQILVTCENPDWLGGPGGVGTPFFE